MDQKQKKPRTLAQVKLQQNLKNAGETLKRHGLKAHTRDKHALVKHRREGRPNSEFFEQHKNAPGPKTVRAPRVNIKNTNFIEMMPETTNRTFKTRKNRLSQLTAMKKEAESYLKQAAKLEEQCARKINTLRNKAKQELQKLKQENSFLTNTTLKRKNTKILRPRTATSRLVSAKINTPKSITKTSPNIFVQSGKKGLVSEKGRAWHANIAKARQDIQTFLKSHGIQEKPTGTVAVKYASLLRKDPSSAVTFRNKILEDIQSKKEGQSSTRKTTRALAPASAPEFTPSSISTTPTSTTTIAPSTPAPRPAPNPFGFLTT